VSRQENLARLLLLAGFTRRDLLDVLRGNGLEDLALSLPRGESDRDDLNRGIQFLAQRGVLTAELLEAFESAPGREGLRDGLADLRVDLELVPPPQPLLDAPTLAALKLAARKAGLHRGVNHARLKHRLPLALRAASATAATSPRSSTHGSTRPTGNASSPAIPFGCCSGSSAPSTRQPNRAGGTARLAEPTARAAAGRPAQRRLTEADRGSLQRIVQEFGS